MQTLTRRPPNIELIRGRFVLNSCRPGLSFTQRQFSQQRLTSQLRVNPQKQSLGVPQVLKTKVYYCQQITQPNPKNKNKALSIWLFICAGLVVLMIIVGGVTRLTESGLSIVEWKPVTGMIPPLSEEAWDQEFQKYQQFPEYHKVNPNMNVQQFKQIFFFEWAHRALGRTIGFVFALPFGYYLSQGVISPPLRNKLLVFFGLGGLQGLIGWWMVKSGLKEDVGDHPRVSAYRLALHLGSALVIYSGLLWTAMSLSHPTTKSTVVPPALRHGAHGLTALVFSTIMSGAFVAGLDAGLLYPEFPYMGEHLVPEEYWELEPKHKNFFENGAAVQFNHRVLACITYFATAALWVYSRRVPTLAPQMGSAMNHLFLMANAQVALGITTLLLGVPTHAAASHQAGAVALLTFALRFMHVLKR